MIVFDKRKYIEAEGEVAYRRYRGWIDECHGKEVVDGRCGFYYIKPEWTVDTDDLVFSLEEYKKTSNVVPNWANRCDGQPAVFDGCLRVKGTNGGTYFNHLSWCVEKSKWDASKAVGTKYQAGNRVLVRSDLEVGAGYGKHNFVSSMAIFKGKLVTITKVTLHGTYQLEEDNGVFYWTDEMFVGLAGSKHLVQSGDVVTTRNGNKYLVVAVGDNVVLMNSDTEGHMRLDSYDSDLKLERSHDEWDVMAIYRPRVVGFKYTIGRIGEANLIWERKEEAKAEPETKKQWEDMVEEIIKHLEERLSGLVE